MIVYKIGLLEGITAKECKPGHVSKDPEYRKTVFRSFRAAKDAYNALAKEQIDAIKTTLRSVKAMRSGRDVPMK